MKDGGITRSAIFSDCRTYRYTLERYWDDRPHVLFVLLNPSTADEIHDDPTNRRGIGFARQWDMGGVVFVNLFAYRTKDPKVLKKFSTPVGPDNDLHIANEADRAGKIVLAWGAHGHYLRRDLRVRRLLKGREMWHLGLTAKGQPKHPLYLAASTPLQKWELP